jgi:hypothetical protein
MKLFLQREPNTYKTNIGHARLLTRSSLNTQAPYQRGLFTENLHSKECRLCGSS